jgi:hypothetical protein
MRFDVEWFEKLTEEAILIDKLYNLDVIDKLERNFLFGKIRKKLDLDPEISLKEKKIALAKKAILDE